MSEAMPTEETSSEKSAGFQFVAAIIKMLEPLPIDEQKHILQTVVTWLHLEDFAPQSSIASITPAEPPPQSQSHEYPFSGRSEISPKEFLLEKDPKTDVEKATCLGYYLTHYREQPYFKTEDLSKLNTEAAQRKFSNAAAAVNNAFRDGFLVQAPKQGFKQLSALGERYIQSLPDRGAAHEVKRRMARRGRSNSKKEQTSNGNEGD